MANAGNSLFSVEKLISASALVATLSAGAFAAPATKSTSQTQAASGQSQAPSGQAQAPVQKGKQGQGEVGQYTSTGTYRGTMNVGKFDPPAAFNLEDIQNFPEDRLQPVLNNPLTFEEGRDFSTMMDFQEEQLYHPWLPEVAKAPYLTMKTAVEKATRDWTFSVIDQTGATVWKQDGKGNPPASLIWNGEDSVREHVSVETVYIPQLATTDKEGYRHTYMGQPVQFSSVMYKDKGKSILELSSKRLFQEKKADLTKEASILLDKVCDVIRENSQIPFAIQPFENDTSLGEQRQKRLVKYFSEKLYVPENQISTPSVASAEKRGSTIAIFSSSTPGSSSR
jgi:hypothetical protein